jgi:hypothetical protein
MLIVLTCMLLKQTGHIWRPLCHVGFLNSKAISLPARNVACVKEYMFVWISQLVRKCPLLLHLQPRTWDVFYFCVLHIL